MKEVSSDITLNISTSSNGDAMTSVNYTSHATNLDSGLGVPWWWISADLSNAGDCQWLIFNVVPSNKSFKRHACSLFEGAGWIASGMSIHELDILIASNSFAVVEFNARWVLWCDLYWDFKIEASANAFIRHAKLEYQCIHPTNQTRVESREELFVSRQLNRDDQRSVVMASVGILQFPASYVLWLSCVGLGPFHFAHASRWQSNVFVM